eukprot:8738278-Lingulodinium_polyedra.AAC.1
MADCQNNPAIGVFETASTTEPREAPVSTEPAESQGTPAGFSGIVSMKGGAANAILAASSL